MPVDAAEPAPAAPAGGAAAAEERLLVHATLERDGRLATELLGRNGIACRWCADPGDLVAEAQAGAGALLLGEEVLEPPAARHVARWLAEQPAWSDLPVLVLTVPAGGGERAARGLGEVANLTLLERPVRIEVLTTAVRAALRSRRRQYQMRDLLHQLTALDRRKDEFLATLSHELRTPLNSVLGWTRMLRDGAIPEWRTDHALEVIERNALAQSRLVADLLDLSSIVTGSFRLSLEPVDPAAVVARLVEDRAPHAAERSVTIEAALGGDGEPVTIDPVRFRQAIANVLDNAIKFTPSGGRVDVELRRAGDLLEVEVRDTGIGMSEEFQREVFQRFRQEDASNTRPFGGLGLGLAITRSIVELHGGRVSARSAGRGRGASFRLTFPVPARQAAGGAPGGSPQGPG